MIKKIVSVCTICGEERTTLLSRFRFGNRARSWCTSTCVGCQKRWVEAKQVSFDVDYWSADRAESALRILEKSSSWEHATVAFDAMFGTTYSLSATRRAKDNEYRSAFKKKFEYTPELDWQETASDDKLIQDVFDAMKFEKARRGGEARFQ
jgi:hypothetical protein